MKDPNITERLTSIRLMIRTLQDEEERLVAFQDLDHLESTIIDLTDNPGDQANQMRRGVEVHVKLKRIDQQVQDRKAAGIDVSDIEETVALLMNRLLTDVFRLLEKQGEN